jgi:hypothetical protein
VAIHYRQCFWLLLQFIGSESAEKSSRVSARQTADLSLTLRFPAADSTDTRAAQGTAHSPLA